MANGARALGEAYPNRFVLGIGVSHAPSVQMRGGDYGNPMAQMTPISTRWTRPNTRAPTPEPPVPLLLAALGPKMLELAAQRSDGAHPYFVPVEHTPIARRRLGPEPCLATEVTAVLTTDRSAGLDVARTFAKHYLVLPNYANNLRRLGWGEADIENASRQAGRCGRRDRRRRHHRQASARSPRRRRRPRVRPDPGRAFERSVARCVPGAGGGLRPLERTKLYLLTMYQELI